MAFMKFYVGNEANASSHRDGIYIAIDTKKIFYNGDAYGGSEVDLSNYATLDDLEGYLPLTGGTMKGNITFESIPVGNVGDAVLYDKQADKLIIVPTTDDIGTKYPSDNYEPIGVVVIPASHDVYGTGECGVMSLKPMNCDTPSTGGTSEQRMYWGVYGTDMSSLPNLNQAPTVGTISSPGNSSGTITGQIDAPYMPSDIFSGKQCPHDTNAYYYTSSSSGSAAPSPYLSDGSRNPGYYQTTSPSSSNNALADFDGVGNTEKIITQRGTKDYKSWTPAVDTEADYPAASCCDMFHTEGTQQGDWYLPACGELGYIMPTFNKINDAIDKMRTAYGSSVGVELTNYGYWSSTEYSHHSARYVATFDGGVYDYGKDNYKIVRAFLRVLPTSNSKGIIISGKSNTDLLNAAGSTTTLKTINNNSLLGSGNIELLTIESIQDITGSNTYTGANYISKETNLTEAVLQLDEEIKATNDNLALEHTNAEATYAKKTELGKKLDISTYTSDKATFALKSDIPNVSNFLTISNAQSTYLTKMDASNIYQPKGSYLTSVSIATISDLNANWDALLKSDPSGYVTRWPNMSEVGSKQNLVIKLNGGTTEGTNQFTYNVTAAKSINITPSSIGAAASSHNHNASQVSGLSKVATSGSYNDLTNKPSIPSAYTLPKATTSTLGGIKVGDGLEITGDGTLNCIIDPGSGTVSWGNIQGKPSVFATNIASINDLNSGWDALLKAAPNIPSLNGYATQEWVNGRGFLTKTTADGYYQPKGNYLTSVSWAQISGKPTILALGTTSSTAFRGDYGNTAYQHATAKGAAFSSGLYKITTNAQGHVTAATKVVKADITALGIPGSDSNPVFQVYHGETKETLVSSWVAASLSGVPSIVSSTRTDTTRSQRLSFPDFGLKKDSTGVYMELLPDAVASRLPTAGSDPGVICLGYPQSGKNYPVELDDNDRAYVNVPWTDTNTTYSAISTSEIDALFS